jgi:hypothetical protein
MSIKDGGSFGADDGVGHVQLMKVAYVKPLSERQSEQSTRQQTGR